MKKNRQKLGRKLLSFLLTLAMVVGLMPGMRLTAYAEENVAMVGDTSYTNFGDALNAWQENTTLTLLADVTITNSIFVKQTKTLDLNGKTIRMTGIGAVIQANQDNLGETTSTFTLKDSSGTNAGVITGGNGDYGGGVYINQRNVFVMEGGTISGNNSAHGGGGVFLDGRTLYAASVHTFILRGGVITGNTITGGSGENVYMDGESNFTMTGGTINGGFVDANNRFVTVSFNANGGNGTMSDQYVKKNTDTIIKDNVNYGIDGIKTDPAFSRAGYIFDGWNTAADGSGTNYTAGTSTINISEATTLYAQWTPIAATAPTISVQPQNLELTYGYTEGSLSVTATAATDTTYNDLTYQWYSNTTASIEGGTEITENGTSSTYAIPTGKTTGTTECYYCVVTATRTDNSQTAIATSDVATVTVGKSVGIVTTAPVANNLTYNGQAQPLVTAGTAEGGEMQYALGTATEATEQYTTSIPAKTDAGTYFVWYRVVGDDYHNGVSANSISVSIGKKALTVTADARSKEYGAEDPELTYTAEGLVEGDTISGNLVRAEGENVGTYAIDKGTLDAGANYEMSFTPALLTITKAEAGVESPVANELTYNGQEQELVTGGTVSGGSILYSLDGSGYSENIPKAKNAGSYTVYYKVAGDDNHNDTEADQITVTILKKSLSITADAKSKKYGERDPELTYTSDGLVEGDEITGALTRAEGESAGTYAISQGTLTAGDNYNIVFTGAALEIVGADKSALDKAISEAEKSALDKAISEAEKYYDSIKGNENYKATAAALKEAIDAAKAIGAKDGLTAAEIAEGVKAIVSALEKAKAEIKVLSGAAEEEKAEERARINKLRTDEIAKLLAQNDNGTVNGMYQTNYDTVSCDIIITKGKITAVTLNKDSIKEGKNYLTFNTGTRIILGDAYTVSDNFADPKDYKKAKRFVKKKKDGYVLDLKPIKSAKGKSYELILIGDKKELIIDVVDVSLNKKGLKTAVLTTAVPESAVSANSVSENSIDASGFLNKDGVLTITTSPNVKAGINGLENRTARFITGVWNVAGQDVVSGGVQTITKGKVKVYAMVKADGTLSIAKAEGSAAGSVEITYTLNGQAKVSNGKVRFKSKVYKTKVKVQ